MPLSNIRWFIRARQTLKPDTFTKFLIFIFDTFSEAQAKLLANAFIGDLGRNYKKIDQGFTCRNMDTAQAIWTTGLAAGKKISIDNYKNSLTDQELYLVRERQTEGIFSDNTSINRFVVSQAILSCLNLVYDNWTDESELYSINNDGVFMTNPKHQYPNKRDVVFSTDQIGKVFTTNSESLYFEKHYRNNFDPDDYTDFMGNGTIYYGHAGCGKTTKLIKQGSEATNPIIRSFTNKAIENVKSQVNHNLRDKCYTFDSYFNSYHNGDILHLEDKKIFIEEYSMTPNKWMSKIYQAFTKYHNSVFMFGDTNQCDPVEKGRRICYDYFKSVAISEICPRRVQMKYKEGCSRYDSKTKDRLTKFLETGKVSAKFADRKPLYKNICYLNSTRQKVTRDCCERFTAGKTCYEVTFVYDGNKEVYPVSAEMPVLVTSNLKSEEIYNMMQFNVDHIDDTNVTINGTVFPISKFAQSFIPAFCCTVYKYQGADINEPYNIYNVNRMDKKRPYTALSRTTKFEYIHLNTSALNRVYEIRKQPTMEIINSYFNSDYSNGKIYKIEFEKCDKVYIGSTTGELKTRLMQHLTNNKSPVYQYRTKNLTLNCLLMLPVRGRGNWKKWNLSG